MLHATFAVWLGVGTALKQQIAEGKLEQLQLMYANWPFFRSTIELLEMVLSKTSKEIAAYYESLLVPEDLQVPYTLYPAPHPLHPNPQQA